MGKAINPTPANAATAVPITQSLTWQGPAGTANDFSADTHCVALWRFENGALTTDSIGSNTLTNTGVTADTTNYREGSASASIVRADSDQFTIADAALDAGFPLKNGDAAKKISLCCWVRPADTLTAGAIYPIYAKDDTNKQSFAVVLFTGGGNTFTVELWIGHTGGTVYEMIGLSTIFDTDSGDWYHLGVTFNDADKSYRIRVYDQTAATVYELTGTATNNVNVEDAAVRIGQNYLASKFDGNVDELVVFDDILSAAEIDQIRGGIYGSLTFDVYFGTTSGALTQVAAGQAAAAYDPPGALEYSRTYYWRVDTINGGTTTGDEWSFTTADAPVTETEPYLAAFPALLPLRETLTWNTGILTGADGSEQRIAHRGGVPVQGFTMTLLARTEALGEQLATCLQAWLKDQWFIPIWPEADLAGTALAAGAVTIPVTTAYADYRAASHALVYQDPDHAEVADVGAVHASDLGLLAPLVGDYPTPPWVMPCRQGYLTAVANRRKWAGGASTVEVQFRVTDNAAVIGWTAALTYDGYDVLTEPPALMGDNFTERYDGDMSIIDAGIGSMKIVSVSDFPIVAQAHGWANDTKAKAWSFRQWLHAVVGRQKTFLVPTFRPDFVLTRACGATDTNLYVANRGRAARLGLNALRTYLAFRPAGATIIPRQITGMAPISATEERLDLDAAPGQAFAAGSELCWLDRCRLATDEVEIQWYRRGKNLCETQFVRVSQ